MDNNIRIAIFQKYAKVSKNKCIHNISFSFMHYLDEMWDNPGKK